MNTTRHAVLLRCSLLLALLTTAGCQLKYVMNFESDHYEIDPGDEVNLHWEIDTRDDVELIAAEIQPDIGAVSPEGSITLMPTESTRYKLVATFTDSEGKALQDERYLGITVSDTTDKEFCFCDEDTGVDREVINTNNPKRSLGNKTLEVLRVTMPGKETHSMNSIKRATRRFVDGQKKLSRGRLIYNFRDARTVNTDTTHCKTAKNAAERARRKSTFVTIITIPCGPQHASISKSKVHIKQNIQMIRHHEVGHVLRLNHSGTWDRKTNSVIGYGDGSSNMSRYGARAYTASQLHGLGWTDPQDTVRIDDYLEQAGYFEGDLRPINKNESGDLPMAFVSGVQHNDRRIWISAPYNHKQQIFVHSQRICDGCGGMFMGTRRLAVLKETGREMQVAGLAITLLDVQKNDTGVFTGFRVRIRPAFSGSLVDWEFNDAEGTKLTELSSNGVISPGPWNRSPRGYVKTNGEGQLVIRPKYSSSRKNSTWFSLWASGNEVNRGKIWLGATISAFQFAGPAEERLHIGLVQDVKSHDEIAEIQLIRTGKHQIHLAAYNGSGDLPESGVPISNDDNFEGTLDLVLAIDFDAGTYQAFYRHQDHGFWEAINDPAPMDKSALKQKVKTSLRMQPLGSYTDSQQEQVLLERLYVTTRNPMVSDENSFQERITSVDKAQIPAASNPSDAAGFHFDAMTIEPSDHEAQCDHSHSSIH